MIPVLDVWPRARSPSRDLSVVSPSYRSLLKILQRFGVTHAESYDQRCTRSRSSIDHGTMNDSVESDRIDARKFGDSLPHRLRIGGISKTRLNSCTSWGGVRALSNNACNVERPGGQALGCPVLCQRSLATTSHPNEGQKLHPNEGQKLR